MASAFSPSGFGSRWLNSENSTSFSELDSLSWPLLAATEKNEMAKIDNVRTVANEASFVRENGLNARASASGIASVFHRTPFRLDLGDAGAALYFHDLIAQKRGPLEFEIS